MKLKEKRDQVRATKENYDNDIMSNAQAYLYFISETIDEMMELPYFKRAKLDAKAAADVKKIVDELAMEVTLKMENYSVYKFR